MYSTPTVLNLKLSRPTTSSININANIKITEQSELNNEFWGKYRYKLEESTTWSDYIIFGSTDDNGIYTINETINNLSALNTYDFEFIFGDSVCTLDTIKKQTVKVIPELEIKKEQVLINGQNLIKKLFNIPSERLRSTDNIDNFYNELGVKVYSIWDELPIGMPTGAYAYGCLVVITQSLTSYFLNTQIYITDSPATHGVFFRNGANTNWAKLTGTSVSKKTG